ncbi:GntR family transcriptional regulator [Mesorhizobium sp. KR9-304]|uniref:GntR family transcriptional regulator n=1 Tax=Mesorhizobium sp. KR9-304 TaxID=3156614 RepID=UPI0032B3B532
MSTQAKPLLQRQTVTAMVADYIASKIIGGDYPGGHQIRQEAIAAELGVSRIPVREALLQLEADGLVVIRTHRGAVVSDLSADDAIDLFDARLLLEPFLVRKAMARMSDEDISNAGRALKDYEDAIPRGDPKELSRLNWAFHIALLSPAMRPRSLAVVQTLYNSADRYLRLQIEPIKAQTKALHEHRDIFEAYRARDIVQTSKLLKKHVSDAAEEIVSQLKASESLA